MEIKQYLEEKRLAVDRCLEESLRSEGPSKKLSEAVRYSLAAGGKRIRPILLLAAYEGCGGDPARYERVILPAAASLEMIHTYSLIHDDLPAMDNDDLRRGRPTSHKVFGEALAILAGDSLLTEAFALLSSLDVKPEIRVAVMREIAVASGHKGMAGGQALDMAAQGKPTSGEELERLHRLKTGCLIRAAAVSGGLLAGASGEALEALRDYGSSVGLAFQIADDILDVEGKKEALGKNVGGDAAKAKATYPSVLGVTTAKRWAVEWSSRAVEALKRFDARADPLREIARFIVERSQ